jgi:hypothetical protein
VYSGIEMGGGEGGQAKGRAGERSGRRERGRAGGREGGRGGGRPEGGRATEQSATGHNGPVATRGLTRDDLASNLTRLLPANGLASPRSIGGDPRRSQNAAAFASATLVQPVAA